MIVYLSLGANLGQREQTLSEALRLLAPYGEVQAVSEYYYSEPWGFTSPNGFCNICARFLTDLTPEALLLTTQQIERSLGRTHKTVHGKFENRTYSDRPIDIDLILAFTSPSIPTSPPSLVTLNTPTLTLPHPLWRARDFVLIPLHQVLLPSHSPLLPL